MSPQSSHPSVNPALAVALAGNPNAGKTTAFNAYTGSRQHVGNYPGITVEQKEGLAHLDDGEAVRIIDLPGIYSLSAYTQEETVARRVLVAERPDAVICLLNACALERNLYLALQLMELGVPLVLGLNMMDEAREQGTLIDVPRLAERLGMPVQATVARQGLGLAELLQAAVGTGREHAGVAWKPFMISYGPDLDPVLGRMSALIAEAGLLAPEYPARWVALKLLENDADMLTLCRLADPALCDTLVGEVRAVAEHLSITLHTGPEAVIADYRYGAINTLLRNGVLVRQTDRHARQAFSDRLDQVLTHALLGPLIMLLVLYLVYHVTFNLGAVPMSWVEGLFGLLRNGMDAVLPEGAIKSLILSGIIDGVGGVMSFVPLIMLIFLFIAFLEDSGYMARMAYMLDRVFRIFGLHGCSVMPFIVGGGIAGGCAVPGVMAARTLRSPREKLATLLTVPFMACGAKLPVFILFSSIFFPEHQAAVMFGLTLTGWLVALVSARVLRSTIIRGPSTPFVMELPPYRLPTLRGLLIHTVERTGSYLKKAGTVILAVSVLFWAAMTYPALPEDVQADYQRQAEVIQMAALPDMPDRLEVLEHARAEAALRHTVAGRLGVAMEPYTRAAGFDWRTDVALLGGFAAKEVIVATLGTAYSLGTQSSETRLGEQIRQNGHWTPASALALLVFVLLYAPCLVTLVVIRQESGSWLWPLFCLVCNTLLAYGLAVAVRHGATYFL